MAFEKTGVSAVIEGFTRFIDSLDRMQSAYDNFKTSIETGIGGKRSGVDILGGVAVGAAAGIAMGAVNALGSAVTRGSQAVKEFASSSVNLAATNEGVAASFNAVAKGANVSLNELRMASRGTISDLELMRTTNVALTGAGKDLSTEFGKNMPTLLRAARVAARATGQDVGFLYNSLISGIKRGSPMLIDNTGLVLKLGEANAAMATRVGKAVEDLSAEEKQIAILNATVAAGERMIATFGESQSSLAETQMRAAASMENMKVTIGQALLPAVTGMTTAWYTLVYAFSSAISEGGSLYPVIVNVGAALSLIADGAVIAAQAIFDWLESLDAGFGSGLAGIAETALRWGVEIVTMLAEGIVMGATSALNFAMDAVGSMLSWWLAPGSPPRVAPSLDKWGAAAMTTYLEGMSRADFGVLERVQSSLSQILSSTEFADVSAQLIQALGAGKRQTVFDTLASSAGEFGAQISELAKREMTLADAVMEVERSEKALKAAHQGVAIQQSNITRLRREYNNLLRSGASKAQLDAKLAEVRASEDALKVNQKAAVDAYKQNEAAKSNVDTLKEQLDLQDRLVKQLLALAKAQQEVTTEREATERAKEPKAAKGKAELPTTEALALPGVSAAPMVSSIGAAIDQAKEALKSKMADIFAPLTTSWRDRMQPAIQSFVAQWNIFVWRIKYKWGEISKMFDETSKAIVGWIPEDVRAGITNFFALLSPAVRTVTVGIIAAATAVGGLSLTLGALMSPMGKLITLAGGVGLGFMQMVSGINRGIEIVEKREGDIIGLGEDILGWIGQGVQEKISEAAWWAESVIIKIEEGLHAGWMKLYTAGVWVIQTIGQAIGAMSSYVMLKGVEFVTWMKSGIVAAWVTLQEAGKEVVRGIEDGIKGATDTLNGLGSFIVEKIGEAISWAGGAFNNMAENIVSGIETALSGAEMLGQLGKIGTGIANAIAGGIKGAYDTIYDALWTIIKAAWDAFQELLGLLGVKDPDDPPDDPGVYRRTGIAGRRSVGVLGQRATPALASVGAQQIYRNVNTTIGPNYINNGIDQTAMQALVERAIVRALRG